MNEYDVAVVGGGAAGLSAALVLARARRGVVVVDAGAPRNAPAAHMQGFLSRDGMPPASCWPPAARRWPATAAHLVRGTVTDVTRRRPGGFEVSLPTGRR